MIYKLSNLEIQEQEWKVIAVIAVSETQILLVHFVQDVSHKHADAFHGLLVSSSHPAEQLNKLRACVTTNGNSS